MTDYEIRNLIEKSSPERKSVVPLINCSSHNLAKHIISSFIAWKNSVRDGKGSGTCMVSYHAHSETFLGLRFVIAVSQTRSEVNDWTNEIRSEEHTSELQSRRDLVCRLLL